MKSFVEHGHRYILYTDGEVLNVPEGIEVRPSSEIWHDERITGYVKTKKPHLHPAALLSDFFRWHLQAKTDYVYMDGDFIALRPFDGWSKEHIEKYGIGHHPTFVRVPKNSPIVKDALKFFSTPYPVPPWYPLKERLRLWGRKLIGKPVSIGELPWATAQRALYNWSSKRHNLPPPDLHSIPYYDLEGMKLPFLPKEQFEFLHTPINRHSFYIVRVGWPYIHEWRPEFVNNPPQNSWIAAKAKEYGIDIAAAPVQETRAKNREYLAQKTGDRRFLL
jgi:hypothetical protein